MKTRTQAESQMRRGRILMRSGSARMIGSRQWQAIMGKTSMARVSAMGEVGLSVGVGLHWAAHQNGDSWW